MLRTMPFPVRFDRRQGTLAAEPEQGIETEVGVATARNPVVTEAEVAVRIARAGDKRAAGDAAQPESAVRPSSGRIAHD